MQRSRLVDVLLVLLIIIASLFLAQMLWQLLSGFSDLILLFLLGWLVSFVLNPVVQYLSEHPIPPSLLDLLEPRLGPRRTRNWKAFKIERASAVVVVYLGLVLGLALTLAVLVPTGITQSTQMAKLLPLYMTRAPEIGLYAQEQLARYGVILNLEDAVRGALVAIQSVISPVVQNALGIFTSLLNLVVDLFFVLILGFYFTLDGPRLRGRLNRFIPEQFKAQVYYFGISVDRTFGAFIRGQLLQAFFITIGTAFVMGILGLDFVLISSAFAGLLMMIPLLGPLLSLIPPLLVVLFQRPDLTLWLLLILFAIQFAVVNVFMPRFVGEAVGLHPLLVFAAILFSIKIGGFWGAFFGIPIAGVIWAMLEFFFSDWAREAGPPAPNQSGG